MSLANQEFLQAGSKMTRSLTVEHFENVARFMNELKAIVVASKERQHFLKTGSFGLIEVQNAKYGKRVD